MIDPRSLYLAACIGALLCLAPAIWRLLRQNPRSLDALWALVALLIVNRLSFIFDAPRHLSLLWAAACMVAVGGASIWYQHHDR